MGLLCATVALASAFLFWPCGALYGSVLSNDIVNSPLHVHAGKYPDVSTCLLRATETSASPPNVHKSMSYQGSFAGMDNGASQLCNSN